MQFLIMKTTWLDTVGFDISVDHIMDMQILKQYALVKSKEKNSRDKPLTSTAFKSCQKTNLTSFSSKCLSPVQGCKSPFFDHGSERYKNNEL